MQWPKYRFPGTQLFYGRQLPLLFSKSSIFCETIILGMIGTGLDSKNIAQTDFETWKRFSHKDVLDLINGFVLVSAKFDEWEKALEGTAEKILNTKNEDVIGEASASSRLTVLPLIL